LFKTVKKQIQSHNIAGPDLAGGRPMAQWRIWIGYWITGF